MARRSSRSAAPRATKSKKSVQAEVEVVEEAGGLGVDTGIAIATSVVLIVAILFVDAYLARLGGGLFLG